MSQDRPGHDHPTSAGVSVNPQGRQEVPVGQAPLLRRGLLLEYTTLGWNVVGVIIVIAAAYVARSVALAGFGLDSLIEIFASVVVVWQLRGVNRGRERLALRLIGIAFIALVIYIMAQLLLTFLTGTHPATSVGGIIWIAATLIAMRQSLDQGLALFHGLCTRLPSLDAYGLKASIWKRSLQLSRPCEEAKESCRTISSPVRLISSPVLGDSPR
jgi:hypothetical protein